MWFITQGLNSSQFQWPLDRLSIIVQSAQQLKYQLRCASALDPGLRRLIKQLGYPAPRSRELGFGTLLQIIVSQQLSTTVAAAIWTRIEKLCRKPVTHRKILNRSVKELRQCGLSRQKVEYARGLAQMVADKTLDLDALHATGKRDVETLIAELVKVRGIGRWSAEIYAMFALGHRDVFPAGDLALQVAIQRYEALGERPDAKQAADLAMKWSPHRSCVALLMWKYYGSATLD